MATSLGSKLAGFALIAIIGVSTVQAATGRILFSGAVVEPTCSTETLLAGSIPPSFTESATTRLSCGRTATDPGRSYSRKVTSLAAADLTHDPLLAYFASYARTGDAGQVKVKVVVHTYD